jgi:site-specific DNA-methyltransferase (adenine-specific)
MKTGKGRNGAIHDTSKGRWPPNGLLCHLPSCRRSGTRPAQGDDGGDPRGRRDAGFGDVGAPSGDPGPNARVYGASEVPLYACVPGCPVAALDEQSGECPAGIAVQRNGGGGKIFGSDTERGAIPDGGYTDTGGASRFFPQFEWDPALDGPSFLYVPKAAAAQRDAGLDGEPNTHVTVKPVALMQWLVRLVTPPGGLVVDPYVGSGTTGIATMLEEGGFRFLGIERDPEYVTIAEARIRHVVGGRYRTSEQIAAEAAVTPEGTQKQLPLF